MTLYVLKSTCGNIEECTSYGLYGRTGCRCVEILIEAGSLEKARISVGHLLGGMEFCEYARDILGDDGVGNLKYVVFWAEDVGLARR